MPRTLRYIVCAFLITFIALPAYPQKTLTAEDAEDAFATAVNLYKQERFTQSLTIFQELKRRLPGWRSSKVSHYIGKCEKQIDNDRKEMLDNAQESWVEVIAAEEYDQPDHASVAILLSECRDLKNQLANKELLLSRLSEQLKKLQADATVFRIKELERENALAKETIKNLEGRLSDLDQKAGGLEEENTAKFKENVQLIQQIQKLQTELSSKPEEKIVYQPRPEDEKAIEELKQKVASLEGLERLAVALNKKTAEELSAAQEELTTLASQLRETEEELEVSRETLLKKEKEVTALSQKNQSLAQKTKRHAAAPSEEKIVYQEKIVYKASPEQEEKIKQLSREITQLHQNTLNDLKELKKELKEKDEIILHLKQTLTDTYSRLEKISQP